MCGIKKREVYAHEEIIEEELFEILIFGTYGKWLDHIYGKREHTSIKVIPG